MKAIRCMATEVATLFAEAQGSVLAHDTSARARVLLGFARTQRKGEQLRLFDWKRAEERAVARRAKGYARLRQWEADHPERVAEYKAAWREANRQRLREQERERYAREREAILARRAGRIAAQAHARRPGAAAPARSNGS